MSTKQETQRLRITPDNEPMYQAMLEEIAMSWAQKHQAEPGSLITVVPPDLDRYPEQRVTEFITEHTPLPELNWASAVSDDLRENLITLGVGYSLAKGLGRNALKGVVPAYRFAMDFRKTPAFANQPQGSSVAEQIPIDMAEGRNILVALPHQDRSDSVKTEGGLIVATGMNELITTHNFTPMNPLMKFEAYMSKYIPRWAGRAGKIVWVIPQASPSASERVPRDFMVAHNRGAAEAYGKYLADDNLGTISYTALLQAGMIQELDPESGKLKKLAFPKTLDSAASALTLTDRALPVAFMTDPKTGRPSWEIGSFIDRESIKGKSKKDINLRFMDQITLDLQERMRKIGKVPVDYTPSESILELRKSSLAD